MHQQTPPRTRFSQSSQYEMIIICPVISDTKLISDFSNQANIFNHIRTESIMLFTHIKACLSLYQTNKHNSLLNQQIIKVNHTKIVQKFNKFQVYLKAPKTQRNT